MAENHATTDWDIQESFKRLSDPSKIHSVNIKVSNEQIIAKISEEFKDLDSNDPEDLTESDL